MQGAAVSPRCRCVAAGHAPVTQTKSDTNPVRGSAIVPAMQDRHDPRPDHLLLVDDDRQLPPRLAPQRQARQLAFEGWVLDTTARHLLDAAGTLVPLTGGEYRLLRTLLDHPQRILSRDQLLNLTQGRDADPFDRSIDLLVSRLRRRLRDDAREARLLKTVRNEGYVFCAAVETRDR